jgi:hypothetical protein
MITVVNKYTHKPTPYDIYCGRGSPLGNPYSHMDNTKAEHKVATREEAIEKYSEWLERARMNNPLINNYLDKITNLARGNDVYLVCYCKPQNCHGDIIKKLIDERL